MYNADPPSVTILIDTYNYARLVGRAIESALQQDYAGPQPEILVVDDGSTDDTAQVVRRYGPRVRYIAKDNGGQASALNVGFREATGDVVCLLDGDDYFYPGKVQLVAGAFRRRPEVGLVYNEFDIVDSAGTSLRKSYPEPTWTGCRLPLGRVPGQLRSLILLGHPWTCITSAMAVRRAVVANLPVPEDVFPHSPDLFLGLVLPFMTEVAIVETPATAYVYHGENMGLFRSSARNRAIYERQMAYIRQFVEERFGVHFPRYGGRSIYDSEHERRAGTTGIRRFGDYLRECRQIAAADVEPAIKRRSQVKLAASLLPDALYVTLRAVRARQRVWRSRQFRRRIAAATGRPSPPIPLSLTRERGRSGAGLPSPRRGRAGWAVGPARLGCRPADRETNPKRSAGPRDPSPLRGGPGAQRRDGGEGESDNSMPLPKPGAKEKEVDQ